MEDYVKLFIKNQRIDFVTQICQSFHMKSSFLNSMIQKANSINQILNSNQYSEQEVSRNLTNLKELILQFQFQDILIQVDQALSQTQQINDISIQEESKKQTFNPPTTQFQPIQVNENNNLMRQQFLDPLQRNESLQPQRQLSSQELIENHLKMQQQQQQQYNINISKQDFVQQQNKKVTFQLNQNQSDDQELNETEISTMNITAVSGSEKKETKKVEEIYCEGKYDTMLFKDQKNYSKEEILEWNKGFSEILKSEESSEKYKNYMKKIMQFEEKYSLQIPKILKDRSFFLLRSNYKGVTIRSELTESDIKFLLHAIRLTRQKDVADLFEVNPKILSNIFVRSQKYKN